MSQELDLATERCNRLTKELVEACHTAAAHIITLEARLAAGELENFKAAVAMRDATNAAANKSDELIKAIVVWRKLQPSAPPPAASTTVTIASDNKE